MYAIIDAVEMHPTLPTEVTQSRCRATSQISVWWVVSKVILSAKWDRLIYIVLILKRLNSSFQLISWLFADYIDFELLILA